MRIIQFTVENHKSFKDETTLSLVSTALKDEPQFRIPSDYVRQGILPVAGVFGANASGKSNILNALLMMRRHVLNSYRLQPDEPIPWMPWRLKNEGLTHYCLEFEIEDVRFEYGFGHNSELVRFEWLYRWQTNRRQVIFERGFEGNGPWYFGPSFTGPKSMLASQTRPNCLFLAICAQNNHDVLTEVYLAFSRGIRAEAPIELKGYPLFPEDSPILQDEHRERVRNLLKAIDVGCEDFEKEEFEIPFATELERLLQPEALEALKRNTTSKKLFQIRLIRGKGADSWTLPPDAESRGTSVMLQRINDLLSHEQGVLVVDELETSLHPDLCAAIIKLYTTENLGGKQLIFTSHDRGLLNQLRRDEVIFVEKDREGLSTLTPLSDYQIRDRDNKTELHAQGRLGGVPILGELSGVWSQG